MNPRDERHLNRFWRSVEWHRKELRPWREKREDLMEQYTGTHYGEPDDQLRKVPVNLIEMMVTVLTVHLAAKTPQILMATHYQEHKPVIKKLELSVNELLREIRFGKTARMTVQDALFSLGIVKCALGNSAAVDLHGFRHKATEPYADRVDFDDWVHDTDSRRFEQISFCGNRYRVPLVTVLESDLYEENAKNFLNSSAKEDDEWNEGEDRVEDLGKLHKRNFEDREFERHVELWDFWVPMENLIVTTTSGSGKLLRAVEWDGPEGGPYHLLGFHDVPNCIMPLSPLGLRSDLHELANALWRKIEMQVRRQKRYTAYQAGSDQDAKRVAGVNDGGVARVDHIDGVREMATGGTDQANLAFAMLVMRKFSEHAGNLEVLAGLGAAAPTATQEELLDTNANQKISSMQQRVEEFIIGVSESLAWYEYTDPIRERQLSQRVQNTDIDVEVTWTPEERENDLVQHEITISPYSLQYRTPGQKLQGIMQIIQTMVLPALPQMMAQGISIDWPELLRMIAKLGAMPELEDIVKVMPQPGDDEQRPGSREDLEPRQAPNTTRTNVRVNKPGANPQDQDDVLTQMFAKAGGLQNSQAAGLSRVAG